MPLDFTLVFHAATSSYSTDYVIIIQHTLSNNPKKEISKVLRNFQIQNTPFIEYSFDVWINFIFIMT